MATVHAAPSIPRRVLMISEDHESVWAAGRTLLQRGCEFAFRVSLNDSGALLTKPPLWIVLVDLTTTRGPCWDGLEQTARSDRKSVV